MTMKKTNSKRYIVIGAGWFGLRAVRTLQKLDSEADVTILELGRKNYIDLNMHAPRVLVEPGFVSKAYPPISLATDAKLVQIRELLEVSSGSVRVVNESGETVEMEADGIIVATGATYTSPLIKDVTGKSVEERKRQLQDFRDALDKSKSVLVVGGGPTGVEVAGEIATDIKNTKVTLINKPEFLLHGSSKQQCIHKLCMKQLKKLGVTVICEDYIESLKEDYVGETKTLTTSKGRKVKADMVIMCTGARPNVDFAPKSSTDEKTGGLIVDEGLLCTPLSSDLQKPVWAIGDCTMYTGRAIWADAQIGALQASVAYYEKTGSVDGGPKKYKHVPNKDQPTLLSIGRRGGAATVPFVNPFVGKYVKAPQLMAPYVFRREFDVRV